MAGGCDQRARSGRTSSPRTSLRRRIQRDYQERTLTQHQRYGPVVADGRQGRRPLWRTPSFVRFVPGTEHIRFAALETDQSRGHGAPLPSPT
jgi:hypothetical protein